MTSARKIKSNRANARLSTGPKSVKGRSRSARNALLHGLSLPVSSDPTLSQELAAGARQIAGTDAAPEIQEPARQKPRLIYVAYAICAMTSSLVH
jgi:hypothetical protein